MNSGVFFRRLIIHKGRVEVIFQDSRMISNRFGTRRKKQWLRREETKR